MTFAETVEKLLSCEGDKSCGFMYIVKFVDGSWDGGFTEDHILPMKKRDDLVKCKNCELEGYMTLTDFHVDEMRRLGSEQFTMQYKTALELAMKSRITMHKRPK